MKDVTLLQSAPVLVYGCNRRLILSNKCDLTEIS